MTAKRTSKRTARQKGAQDSLPAQRYEPTPQEQAALEDLANRRKETAPLPKIERNEDGSLKLRVTGEDSLRLVFGTESDELANGLLRQIANATEHEQDPNLPCANFMLSVVKGVEPQDEIEAMLATQMAAVHMATMTFAWRLAHAENIPQQDSAERAFNKLARTFTTQIEALKRYRTGGEQKVTVQHVTVNEGGQAVVGNVSHSAGGRGAKKK